MALTMVHLLAAERWARLHPEFMESPEYYLGAISPDAIHIRDHDDKSHKNEIHLNNWQSPHLDEVEAYWRGRSSAFDAGYGVHVLTDAQWVPRYRERLPGLMKPNGWLDVELYQAEAWVTDFRLLRRLPALDRMLELLERAEAPHDHPLLTWDELDGWRRLTLEAYRGECPRQCEPRFITEAYALEFVEDTPGLIERAWREAMGRE